VRRVLEAGAGIGNTAMRMAALGWDVTALEPDPVLFQTLEARLGSGARCESLLSHNAQQPYDALIAESVFCVLDLAAALAHAGTLLKPGGYLALVDAVWTDKVTAAESSYWHDRTQHLFGIPVGSRERLTRQDWCTQLQAAGFVSEHTLALPPGSAGTPPSGDWRASLRAMIRDPRLLLWMTRYRMRMRGARPPAGSLESLIFIARWSGARQN